MKHIAKRSFSLLLALILCLNLLPGLSLTADAATPLYNWGSRGTTATYLSDNAVAWYAAEGASYEELSQLSGNATQSQAYNSDLFRALNSLMAGAHSTGTSYNATKSLFQYTDCQNGSGKISSFYSGVAIGPEWNSNEWNREHTWPNSKSSSGSDGNTTRETDIIMLRPTSISENSSRGNKAYGESSGYYNPNSISNGAYDLRGDVARIVLFVYVRYGTTDDADGCLDYMWGSSGVIESKDVLLKWMEADPVDTWELGRNDSVESITGTRNVFVDYPELAFLLFEQAVPGDMVTPSGKAAEKTYNITVTSNNDAWGTVTVSGKNINCTPAEGYRVKDYTVLSGTATAEKNGNVFVVTADGDCSIQVNFEKREAVTLTFLQSGSQVSSESKLADDVITLPGHTGAVPEGFSFRGWLATTLAETTEVPSAMLAQGASYTLTGDITLHAVYSWLDSAGEGTAQHFERYTGTITEGDYLIVQDGGAMKASVTSGGRLHYQDVSVVNNTVSLPDASLIWHIAPLGDGYWTIYNQSTDSYAASTGENNKAQLLSGVTDQARWTPSGSSTYDFVNKANTAAGANANLRRNTTFGFATYAASYSKPSELYKGTSGTTYYTTSTVTYTVTAVSNNDAWGTVSVNRNTVTATPAYGYEVGTCTVLSGEADVSRQGNTFHITPYSDCQIQITFKAREAASLTVYENGTEVDKENLFVGDEVTMPEHTGTVPAGYTFEGWTNAPVNNADSKPVFLLKAGNDYLLSGHESIYALYKSAYYTTTVYAIEAESGDGKLGTVSVSGQIITATPAEGYQIAGYEVLSGEAELTREANTYLVRASSDCTIRVNFEERTVVTATFMENGTEVDSQEGYPPYTVLTPDFSGELLAGYTFVGWTVGEYTGQELPETLLAEQESLVITEDVTVCALYKAKNYTTSMVEIPKEIFVEAEELGESRTVWLDGREYPVTTDDRGTYVTFEGDMPATVVSFTYHIGDEADVHTHYPTAMKLWSVALTDGEYVATRHAALDDLLQYSGCSIRITGKKGIRMITSVDKSQKSALTGKGLDGFTLVEYGTLLCFASDLEGGNPMILGQPYSRSNHAYKKDANGKVTDPVFAYNGNQVQYTNVLVGFSLDQCKDDIAMRPYMILKNAEGQEITVYGGVIYRSIGYIAYQNRTVFQPGNAAYDYVWEIIHHVYGDAFDADYENKGEKA